MSHPLAQNLFIEDVGGKPMPTLTISGPIDFKFKNTAEVINSAIPYVFAFAGVGLLLMIISAGFTLLTSAGDAKKMETGKNQLTYALVGFIIIFVAYWIVQALSTMFGLTTNNPFLAK